MLNNYNLLDCLNHLLLEFIQNIIILIYFISIRNILLIFHKKIKQLRVNFQF